MYLDLRTVSKSLVEATGRKIESQKSLIKFRPYDEEKDADSLLHIYNRAFMVSPDPYQKMQREDVTNLKNDIIIFMASYLGKDTAFIWLTLDEDQDKKVATISLVAVLPEKQRRGIATSLALYSYDYLKDNQIYHLGCIVGEKNKNIQSFVKFIGFKKFGEEILEY